MTWPRAFALADVLWSPKGRKNWPDFVNRVEAHFRRFDAADINYARSMYNPIVAVKKPPLGFFDIFLSHELPDAFLYYTTDSTLPDDRAPLYTRHFLMPKGANVLKVIAYRNGKPIGRMVELTVADLAKRMR